MSDDTEFAIEVEYLTKHFGTTTAIDELTFRVEPGVICGFVGPNGSGKTTTMRILATLLQPDAGWARVFGHSVANERGAEEVRRQIGFMPDYFGLYRDMSAVEYLEFFAAAFSIPPAERPRLVGDILAVVGLEERRHHLVSELSRGMQQRLSLGRCLVHSPRLLLLDEPASGLDPRARIELMELLRELKRMGKTVFISSHILSELGTLCDRVLIIEQGKVVYTGTLEEASTHVRAGRCFMELTIAGEDGAAEAAIAVVEQLDGVREIRRQGLRLYVEHVPACSPAVIIAACVEGGVQLLEARRGEARLEEVFLSLTKGE